MGPEWIVVRVVVLVLFGGSQLPKLARGFGSAQREFKKGLDEGADDDDKPTSPTELTPSSPRSRQIVCVASRPITISATPIRYQPKIERSCRLRYVTIHRIDTTAAANATTSPSSGTAIPSVVDHQSCPSSTSRSRSPR